MLPSVVDRGSGSSLRAGSQKRIGKSCPCPPFVPIAFWYKGVGLRGHAAGASRLPGVFAAFVGRSSVLERMGWADLASVPWEYSGLCASSPLGQKMGFTEREGRFMDRPPERLYLRGVI